MKFNLLQILLTIPGILVAFTFHEYAHALVADRLGDKTPRFQGRLTLNPIAHIDPIGFLMILVFRFGWAKPVETNPRAYKNYYKDDLKVSIAGPIANVIVAFVFAIFYGIFSKLVPITIITSILAEIIRITVEINCMLFFFNMIPLPGLDGFHVLRDLYPKVFYDVSEAIYRYQMIILLIFVATPIAGYIIGIPATFLYTLFMRIGGLL